ncbi:GNAT family N-acetyltransferase [Methanolobus sp. ZRKC5]|uniref:GNAT family N-acetyltransferase n=1 Tax=unclassified Methanolobus TaxID=2629569 RepID=UPI00313EE454
MNIRKIREEDVTKIEKFISLCKPLDQHSTFTYWVLARYFDNTCFVVEENNEIVGYVSGVKSSSKPDVFYIWQIGISPEHRKKRLSSQLIKTVVEAAVSLGSRSIQVSIDPENNSSFGAFLRFAGDSGLQINKIDELELFDQANKKDIHEYIYEM